MELKDITSLFTGQYAILAWFLLAVVVIYIPAMALYLLRRKRRAAAFLQRHRDAAQVRILRGKVAGELTVYAVDGEWPVLDGKGINMVLYLTPGEHILGLTYRYDKLSLFGKLSPYKNANRTVQGKSAEKRVIAAANGKYLLSNDIADETYRFAAEDDGERTKHGKGM
ncbi:MAG: hypothetical protein LBI87_01000 [Candidatus Accumulibacter sp.]|jgi:hypothetical protein|nr:hypothetical protein [Accumulibacter sp.]